MSVNTTQVASRWNVLLEEEQTRVPGNSKPVSHPRFVSKELSVIFCLFFVVELESEIVRCVAANQAVVQPGCTDRPKATDAIGF
jgi:hypothetical protein